MNSSGDEGEGNIHPHEGLLDRHLGVQRGRDQKKKDNQGRRVNDSRFHDASCFCESTHAALRRARLHHGIFPSEEQCKRDGMEMETR
jgi:hypothetical protein